MSHPAGAKDSPPFTIFLAIALLSTTALSYEILLMRLLSIIQWHHFAYMIISLALLGYGASGSFLALCRRWLEVRFLAAIVVNAVLFALSMPLCFAIAQQLPFNPLGLVWDGRQQLYLLATYLLFTIPFFCAANCVGLTFIRYRLSIGLIYRADMLGAGVGAVGIVLLLFITPPQRCILLLTSLALLAAAVVMWRPLPQSRWPVALLVVSGLLLPLLWPQQWSALRLSEYKGLSQQLQVVGSEVVAERSSPFGLLSVVRSPTIPLRHAPGLSLHNTQPVPEQLGLFTDGDAMNVITRYRGERDTLAYLDQLSSALPYHLLQRPKVLILGAGSGSDLLQARYHRVAEIDAVEINPQVVALMKNEYRDYSGGIYAAGGVRLHIDEARGFIERSGERYGLIQLALLDSFAASSAGVHALSESYLYTVEALQAYIQRLQPGGMLAITRWLNLPPRDNLKLFATAIDALRASGVARPGDHLALIRSWKTSTLLIKNGAFTPQEITAIEAFCEQRSFDIAYHPRLKPQQANRFNLLQQPYLYQGATALLGDGRDAFVTQYKFNIEPATDNRPYFFHFFKWGGLTELISLRGQGGLSLLEWGYLILFATLLQALLISLLLIIMPLWWSHRRVEGGRQRRLGASYYFVALGLAFLFIEIAFIQKFILFLAHPLYAIAVVLCGFLIFAGLGSGYSVRLSGRFKEGGFSPVTVAVVGIVVIALVYLVMLPVLFQWLMPLPDLARILISLLLIAPLAFCMGMPFPLGLGRVAVQMPAFIPWAWGLNGCASVISAILATILAIHFGFVVVVVVALLLYLSAAMVMALGEWK